MPKHSIEIIGKAWIKDIDALKAWYADAAPEWHAEIWKDRIYPMKGDMRKYLSDCRDASNYSRGTFEESGRNLIVEKIKMAHEYAVKYGIAFEIAYLDDRMAAVKHGNLHLLLPPEFIRYELYKDYDSVSLGDMALLSDNTDSTGSLNMIPVQQRTSGLTRADHLKSAEELQREIKSIEDKTHKDIAPLYAELERMKKEMTAKQQEMMAMMEAMIEELETKKFQLGGQIFVLDSQIYSIRCFNGEVVDFTTIRNGRHSPEDTPVVLFQKVRYLDEELGQLTSIYSVEGGAYKVIEELLKYNDLAFERFCPSPKCVTVMRVSRNGRVLAPHHTWTNCLDAFEFHHSHRVCILIRNGDALYAGWTDEERIDIAEDAFFTPGETIAGPGEEVKEPSEESSYSHKQRVKNERDETKREMERRASRMFLFTILQGLLERKEILALPEKYSIIKSLYERNPYIVFSAADNWLESNAYASFAELIWRCNQRVQEGDSILTLLRLRPEFSKERWNKNDRGIGYNDRTHDVAASDATVYPVNKVVLGDEYRVVTYTTQEKQQKGQCPWTTQIPVDAPKGDALISTDWSKDGYIRSFSEDTVILDDVVTRDRTCYISLEKEWSEYGARANFQVHPEEYINLTYMNSVWLLYTVSSKKLGSWRAGGKEVSYAYAIRYLNKALEFVREREKVERDFILAEYPGLDDVLDWPAVLSEWKLEKGVRQITTYQAKRFAIHLRQRGE